MRRTRFVAILVATGLGLGPTVASAVTIFSEGMRVPQTISAVPAGFGSGLEGDYLVPDSPLGTVHRVPQAGGPPVTFATLSGEVLLGGLFLPATPEWGANAGRYLSAGYSPPNDSRGRLYAFDGGGAASLFAETAASGVFLTTPTIAPEDFGARGGQLLVSAQGAGVLAVTPAGVFEPFATPPELGYFGLAFAPADFGSVGGTLLAGISNGTVWSIQPDGTTAQFATIPLLEGQRGLRQMEFAPPDFLLDLGIGGQLLLVSVSGSVAGGGSLGDVVAVDASGAVVASLRVLEDLDKFDPRGMLFTDAGELLVSDASDPIILATAADFRLGRNANQVPEPATAPLLALGLVAFMLGARGRQLPSFHRSQFHSRHPERCQGYEVTD